MEYILLAGITGSWDTVVNAAGATLTETMLNDLFQAIWEVGGVPDLLLLNGYNQRVITSWATPRIRTEIDQRMAGAHIGTYMSDFGEIPLFLDRHLRPSDLIILTKADIGIGPLQGRAFSSRVLPQLGDYTQTEILGEYTMEVHRPTISHGWIYNLATS